jgi:putative hydrolase of the HAD superfamily
VAVSHDTRTRAGEQRSPALVLDFGGPVLLTPFELAGLRAEPGSPVHTLLAGRGPLAPIDEPDPDWRALQACELTEREYWAHRARDWAAAGGHGQTVQQMISHLFEPAGPELVRPEALSIIHDAKAAGRAVGVLTNDLKAFHADEWIEQMHVLDEVDTVVDGSVEGYLKPHPRLYEVMAERLGVSFEQMVFVDDQMSNVAGARALGIPTVEFHPRDPEGSFAVARRLLGLSPSDHTVAAPDEER